MYEYSPLILLAHPQISNSKAGKALAAAAENLPQSKLFHLDSLKKEGAFNVSEEIEKLKKTNFIVWQFPLYWYSVPSALRDWQDQVLSAVVYGSDNFLKGKALLVAFTAGAEAKTFRAGGLNGFSTDEMLRPLQMTVNAAGMRWITPFSVYGCGVITEEKLSAAALKYKEYLQDVLKTL